VRVVGNDFGTDFGRAAHEASSETWNLGTNPEFVQGPRNSAKNLEALVTATFLMAFVSTVIPNSVSYGTHSHILLFDGSG
jgi:hypothetical protein